jgi:5-methyltetrahydrofolate--homocysteine methyltransferase
VSPSFLERLGEGRVLVADGATGTSYQERGLEIGMAPEEWLFHTPERVVELHRAFVDAGSEILLTDTFGATPLRLQHTSLAGRVREVNVQAVELAREAAGDRVLVAGSMGPTGHLFEPLGPLTRAECVENYAAQAGALTEGDADLLLLETFFSLDEALAAIDGTRQASDLPLVVTFSFDQGTRTMMGHSPTHVAEAILPLGVAAIGANCGKSLADADVVAAEFIDLAGDVPVWIKPNAGVPKIVGDEVVYEAGPTTLAAHVRRYVEQGARIVGGCCGSTPEHVAAVARAVADLRDK